MKLRVFVIILLLMLTPWLGYRLYHHLYYRYLLTDLVLDYSIQERWETPLPPDNLQSILSQPFHYLGQGAQSYAFVSKDGNYVLKIFHYKHTQNETKKHKLIAYFNAYSLGYQLLPEECGIIYQQLTPATGIEKEVFFTDRLGLSHKIQLQNVRYVIQKKTIPAQEIITPLLQANNTPQAKIYIQAITDLIEKERKLGLYDIDTGVLHNMGFIGSQLVHFDLGKLVYDPAFCSSENFNAYKARIIKRFPASLQN